jgi:signal peptidase
LGAIEQTDRGTDKAQAQRSPRAARKVIGWLVFALVLLVTGTTVGPSQLGGPASYVIVDGPSMQPTYQRGDLVVVRAKESYLVGDVVAYLPDIGQEFPVIHRIVGIEGEGTYLTQGDNRAEADGWLATDDNIFGAAWLHVPYGGRFVLFLREPTTWLVAAIAMLGLALIAGASPRSKQSHRHLRRRGPLLRRYSTALSLLLVMAFSIGASAADLSVDGGVLQQFRVDPSAAVVDPVDPRSESPGSGDEAERDGLRKTSPSTTTTAVATTTVPQPDTTGVEVTTTTIEEGSTTIPETTTTVSDTTTSVDSGSTTTLPAP